MGTRAHPEPTRRRGPRHDLDAAQVLDAFDAVLDREGAGRLSLRRVAAEVGMAPNAVYTYFPTWEDVLQDAADRFLGRLDLSLLATNCPRCGIAALLDQAIALLRERSGMADVLTSQRTIGPASLALNEALLDFFAGHLPGREHVAVDLVTTWVFGEALLITGEEPTPVTARRLAALDPDAHPRTASALQVPPDATRDVLLDGLGLRHERHATRRTDV